MVQPYIFDLTPANQRLDRLDATFTTIFVPPVWTSVAYTMGNGWADYGTFANPVKYYKDFNGRVYIRGAASGGTIAVSMFTLPIGYRPPVGTNVFPVVSNGAFGFISIDTSGLVVPFGSNVYITLDGISFLTT